MVGNPAFQHTRFRATTYGIETLASLRVNHLLRCHYFHESIFFKHREVLDGIVYTFGDQLQVCVNTLSPRANDFRSSDLIEAFRGGIYDPDKRDGVENGYMIADCSLDRKDLDGVKGFLREKYSLDHLQDLPLKKHSVAMGITPGMDSEET